MRALYLVTDPGIPLDGNKGASVHVRAVVAGLSVAGHEVRVLATRPGTFDPSRVMAIDPGDARGEDRHRMAGAWVDDHHDEIAAWFQPDLIVERLALFPGAGRRLADRLGATYLIEMNAPLAEEANRHRGLEDFAAATAAERDALASADGVMVVSRALHERVSRIRGGDDGVLHLPNGVDVARFQAAASERGPRRAALGVPPDACVAAFVSTLKPWHGISDLADAFLGAVATGAPLWLLLIGDGPEREALAERLRPAANRVIMTGTVTPPEVAALLQAADVGVAPYPHRPDFYFSPLKVAEYAAAGLPVVMSDLPDLVDLLPVGAGAIAVAPGDVAALQGALERMARDRDERQRLGESAREHAARHLDWSRRMASLEQFARRQGSARTAR